MTDKSKKELTIVSGHVGAGKSVYCQSLLQEGTRFFSMDGASESLKPAFGYESAEKWDAAPEQSRELLRRVRSEAIERTAFTFLKNPKINRLLFEDPGLLPRQQREVYEVLRRVRGAGHDVSLRMLFRQDTKKTLEDACIRDLDPDDPGIREKAPSRVQVALDYQGYASTAFFYYVNKGVKVKLYENRLEDGLHLVAEAKNPELGVKGLEVIDPDAFLAFLTKSLIRSEPDIRVRADSGREPPFTVGIRNLFYRPSSAQRAGLAEFLLSNNVFSEQEWNKETLMERLSYAMQHEEADLLKAYHSLGQGEARMRNA